MLIINLINIKIDDKINKLLVFIVLKLKIKLNNNFKQKNI